ncbi:MAG TPA: efflux transporter outer membrane subunit [Steroidobacteraceae bacterium]|nr:efflux transporter outer membrane subunit [Steroidobacteraceae bacterium]
MAHRRWGAAATQLLSPAACALLVLSACKVGPDFERPPSPVAERWLGEPPGVAAEPADMADWWKLFNDATLNSLIDSAYHNNLSLQVAAARILQAQAQLNVAIGELFPQQQALGGQVQRERQSGSTLLFPGQNPVLDTSQIGFSASWELDFWGKYRRGIEADRASMLASVAAYDSGLVSVTAGVASTYLNIRVLQQQIEVVQDNVKAQQESRRIAQAQFEAGETSQLDVEQAETQLAQTQAQIPGLENSLQAAKDSLAVLLGVTPDAIDALLGAATAIPVAPAAVATGMPKDLLRRRPDVRQAELTAAAQSAAIGVAKSNLYPAFSLTGSFGFAGTNLRGNSISDLFSWDNRAAAAGASFVFPIFNYGRIVNSVRVQDAVFEEAVLNYQNTVLQAQQEVEDARASFAAAQAALATLIDAADSARRTTELAIVRYKEGAADYTTVLTAQQLQLQIEQALASARGAVPLALVSVYRALGGGWQLRAGQQLLPQGTRKEMKERTNWGHLPDSAPELPMTEESATRPAGDAVAH